MDEATRREIEKVIWRTLRDAGLTEPPVHVEPLLSHLNLYRQFYKLQDPTVLDRAKHRIQIHGMKLVNLIKKIKLVAVLFYDEDRIVVDADLPEIKRDFPSFHESTHRILEWHQPYFYGDTAQTLDPDWHERLEAEANYGASALMFCGPVFTGEARDTAPEWATIVQFKKRYGKSLLTSLRRYVEHGPDHSMAMLVSTPFWKDQPEDQPERWRHFVPSPQFARRFPVVIPEDITRLVDEHSTKRIGGPVANFTCPLMDCNGERYEFRGESFYNRHYILTLLVELRKLAATRVVMPGVAHR